MSHRPPSHPALAPSRLVASIRSRLGRLRGALEEISALLDALEQVAEDAEVKARGANVVHLPCSMAELERAAIEAALRETDGNKERAAEILGITRSTIYNKVLVYAAADEARAKRSGGGRAKRARQETSRG